MHCYELQNGYDWSAVSLLLRSIEREQTERAKAVQGCFTIWCLGIAERKTQEDVDVRITPE